MENRQNETHYENETEELEKEAALMRLLIAFSFDICEMKKLLYSYREKLTKRGKFTNRKIHYR